MAFVRRRHITTDVAWKATDLNMNLVEVFKTPYTAATAGMTLGDFEGLDTILAKTSTTAGAKSITQGQFNLQCPDVPRDVEVYIAGGASTHITGGTVELKYYTPWGSGPHTKLITGFTLTAGATEVKKLPSPNIPVGRMYSASIATAGGTLTGLVFGICPGAALAVSNKPSSGSVILSEDGQSTPPTLNTTTGLFTPGTTLDGTKNVVVRVFYGPSRAD